MPNTRERPATERSWRQVGTRRDGGGAGAPADLPSSQGGVPATETRYLEAPARGILNSAAATGMSFWSANPYIGCEFGCAYCYARDTHRWTVERAVRGDSDAAREIATLPATVAFERRILAKTNGAALLARELRTARVSGVRIMFGTATDPYQPAERRLGLTRAMLDVFLDREGLRLGVITKSALIMRDAELLGRLARRHDVSVSISLASADAVLLRRLEPRTPIPAARLRAMRALADRGVRVGLLAAPILPGINDDVDGLRALLARARAGGARWARYGTLLMGPATRATLMPWLERHRPELAARYRRHYGTGRFTSREYALALRARFERLVAEAGIPQETGASGVGEQVELWDAATAAAASARARA